MTMLIDNDSRPNSLVLGKTNFINFGEKISYEEER